MPMTSHQPLPPTRPRGTVRLIAGLLLGLGASACGGGSSPSTTPGGGQGITGGSFFFTDTNPHSLSIVRSIELAHDIAICNTL